MESQCIRVKLKPGKTQEFLDWANTLANREHEVKESLLAEGMNTEIMLLERGSDGDYVMLYTRAKSLAEANKAFERSPFKVDQEAKAVMAATWDFGTAKVLEKILEVIP